MDTFTDYYAVLGVDVDASPSRIKAAFKKLALQYHPDVYKGEDAQERMRNLLLAYQTLSDSVTRKAYDARRAEHVIGKSSSRGYISSEPAGFKKSSVVADVMSSVGREGQRHIAFPDLSEGFPSHIELGDMTYDLSSAQAHILKEQGMLRGVANEAQDDDEIDVVTKNKQPHHCHRCHYRWTLASQKGDVQSDICPSCKARDWAEYLLLRCDHCHAVFESEQIRYEVGTVNYGNGTLCPPYELFPLCPNCRRSSWCPAENRRVETLRQRAARHAAVVRFFAISLTVVIVVVLGMIVVGVLH